MIVLTADSASELFTAACQAVLLNGRAVSPRDHATTEVIGAHLCLTNSRRRIVHVPPSRVINPAFAVAEALWILSGSDDPWIFDYNDNLRQYATTVCSAALTAHGCAGGAAGSTSSTPRSTNSMLHDANCTPTGTPGER